MSGFRLEYDLTRPTGERLRSVLVPCQADCGEAAEMSELVDAEVYSVVRGVYAKSTVPAAWSFLLGSFQHGQGDYFSFLFRLCQGLFLNV